MLFRIPNQTSDPETGVLTTWTEAQFIERFRRGRVFPGSKMPWEAYREMTDTDLLSIHRFLKTLQPVRHYVGPTRRNAGDDPTADPGAQKI